VRVCGLYERVGRHAVCPARVNHASRLPVSSADCTVICRSVRSYGQLRPAAIQCRFRRRYYCSTSEGLCAWVEHKADCVANCLWIRGRVAQPQLEEHVSVRVQRHPTATAGSRCTRMARTSSRTMREVSAQPSGGSYVLSFRYESRDLSLLRPALVACGASDSPVMPLRGLLRLLMVSTW